MIEYKQKQQTHTTHISGTVIAYVNNNYIISYDAKVLQAQLAQSCMLVPKINDKVLIAKDQENDFYIIAILSINNKNEAYDFNLTNQINFNTESLTFNTKSTTHICDDYKIASTQYQQVNEKASIYCEDMLVQNTQSTYIANESNLLIKSLVSSISNFMGKYRFFNRSTSVQETVESQSKIETVHANHTVRSGSAVYQVKNNMKCIAKNFIYN